MKYNDNVNKSIESQDLTQSPPEPDELEAILKGRRDRAKNGTVPHDAINWD